MHEFEIPFYEKWITSSRWIMALTDSLNYIVNPPLYLSDSTRRSSTAAAAPYNSSTFN